MKMTPFMTGLVASVVFSAIGCAEFTRSPAAGASQPASDPASRETASSSQPASSAAANDNGVESTLSKARSLIASGNQNEAEALLLAARKTFGNQSGILLGLASIARIDRRFSDSRELARKVLLRDQNNADAISLVALSYVDEKKLDLAEVYCSTALRHLTSNRPASSQLLGTLAFVYYKRGDTQKAVNTFRRATEADANNAVAHADLGLIALSFRDYALAKTELEKAANLGRTDKTVSAGRCYAFEGLHAIKEATACLQDLIARIPPSDSDLPGYLYSLGVLATAAHDHAGALAAFHRYVELKGSSMSKKDHVLDLIHRLEADERNDPAKKAPAASGKQPASPPGSNTAGGKVPVG